MSEDNRSARNVTNYFEYSPEEMKWDRSINWNERKTQDMVRALHHIETEKNVYDGVNAYNSKVSYVGKINDHLSDMGCSPLVDKPLIDSL